MIPGSTPGYRSKNKKEFFDVLVSKQNKKRLLKNLFVRFLKYINVGTIFQSGKNHV